MRLCKATHRRGLSGFTLIELMVTVVIISILAAIAVPSYTSSVRKSRRTEARTALLDLAGREERYLAAFNHYSDTAADLGYSAFPSLTVSSYYNLKVTATSDGTATAAASFTAQAVPVAGHGQDKDLSCQVFQIDSTGTQSSTNSTSADSSSTCWH